MSELEKVEAAIEGEVKSVETKVDTVAEAVVAEVKAEASKVEGEVVAKEKAAIIQLKSDEKLFLREAELEFLKAQMQIQNLTKITEAKTKEYQTYVENLFKTYVIDKSEYVFDATVNAFKKL
jgi:hypothetical protein